MAMKLNELQPFFRIIVQRDHWSWKVMEFRQTSFQAWKVMHFLNYGILKLHGKIAYHLRFLRLKHRVIYLVRTFRHILRLFYQLRRVHVTQRNNTECIDVLNKQTHKCDKVTKSNALPVDIKCTIHIIIHCNIPRICFQVLCSVCE